jgi:hypothetical protein
MAAIFLSMHTFVSLLFIYLCGIVAQRQELARGKCTWRSLRLLYQLMMLTDIIHTSCTQQKTALHPCEIVACWSAIWFAVAEQREMMEI